MTLPTAWRHPILQCLRPRGRETFKNAGAEKAVRTYSMAIYLERWEERLGRHFETLAVKRAGSGFPLFALEHGLEPDEYDQLASLLLARLKSGAPLSPHWLCWVVYATERGYEYAGDEYWQSFEEHTPHWEGGDRYKIVPWFK